MTLSRRLVLTLGGGALATLTMPARLVAAPVEVIEMRGSARGERVWFSPRGLAVPAGSTLRFVNRDKGNSHTSTAYHPALFDRKRRIPKAAQPWDSDYLLPDDSFEVTLIVPGVYDYYCLPHEMAGMTGRVVVGVPADPGWEGPSDDTTDLEPEALSSLPPVDEILAAGRVVTEPEE
ncbi:plastocyanin/azurin family copper-binding protein [Albidovulum sp.]|jgi:plastocyanin|uniref:plastocyanin/azurin family copper-binding protein n=1 Tax=Albidovulum sp. TaxID=1872424 RepID=UPI003039849B